MGWNRLSYQHKDTEYYAIENCEDLYTLSLPVREKVLSLSKKQYGELLQVLLLWDCGYGDDKKPLGCGSIMLYPYDISYELTCGERWTLEVSDNTLYALKTLLDCFEAMCD